ncbi:hypothetical protein CMU99_06855 [Elizabethkingia anophelis]|nr:hypothetical protein [Elizabethkingia anophelis]
MVILLLLPGCSAKRKAIPAQEPVVVKAKDSTSTTKTVTIFQRDTVLVSKPDSVYYEAWIECVNNKPVLRDPITKQTENAKTNISLENGKLSVQVITEAQKLFLKWKEKYIKEHTNRTIETPVPYPVIKQVEVPAELTRYQIFYLTLGKIVFWGLLVFIIIKIPWKSFLR